MMRNIFFFILVTVSFLGTCIGPVAAMAERNEDHMRNAKQTQYSGGVVYERWGRKDCPSSATMLYSGLIAGGRYAKVGGIEFTCLPLNPPPVYVNEEQATAGSWIYSTEYNTRNDVFPGNTNDYDAPCAVCFVEKGVKVMIPGHISCPQGWAAEYTGYLMSEYISHRSTNGICVDAYPENLFGSEADDNGALLYFVVADCNHSFMPCDPFKHLVPITCVVCTR